MAATYLTIGSKFKPYSFEEYVKPLNMYKEEYQRQEDLYNTYAETAGLIGADLNPELDSDILNNTYNPYMQALSSGADTLATEGLTPGGRKQLQELRRRFGREITPIKVASEARAKARENWDKMLAQDKTLMTNANPYYKGVSAYMNGASPDTTYVSGNELYSRGQAMSKALSNVLRKVPSGENLALGDQYFRIAQEKGFNSDEMKDFLDRVVKTNPELESQIEKIMQSSGIYNKGFTEADINRAEQYIIEGMASGMSGDTKVNYMQNLNFMSDYDRWKKRDSEKQDTYKYPSQYKSAPYQRVGKLYDKYAETIKRLGELPSDKKIYAEDFSRKISVESGADATKIMQDYHNKRADFESRFRQRFGFDFKIPGFGGTISTTLPDGTVVEISKVQNGTFSVRTRRKRTMNDRGIPPMKKDENLTNLYNEFYAESQKLSSEEDFYKESGVKKAALSDKELQEIRQTFNIPEDTDVSDYIDIMSNNPEVKIENRNYIEIDAAGEDGKKYRNALTESLFSNLIKQSKGEKINKINLQNIPTKGSGVYILDNNFEHKEKVKSFGDIFTLSDDGHINNINNFAFTPQSIINGSAIATVFKNNRAINVEIPLEYFGNELASVLYSENPITGVPYIDSMRYYVNNGEWDNAEKLAMDIGNLIALNVNLNFHQRQGNTISTE